MFFLLRYFTHGRALSLRSPGLTTGVFLMAYGVFRIVAEYFKEWDVAQFFTTAYFSEGVVYSLPMIALGAYLAATSSACTPLWDRSFCRSCSCSAGFSCSCSPPERLGLTLACSSGLTCSGCRPQSCSSSPSDTKPRAHGRGPSPGAWSKPSDTPCAWSASSSPTSCSSASPAPRRSSPCSRGDGYHPPSGTLLSTAVRFLPLTLTEARRIYDIQRCRGLRLRPWAPRTWLPIIVPLFVSQMCRAHDTSVMLVVRRMATGTGAHRPGSSD